MLSPVHPKAVFAAALKENGVSSLANAVSFWNCRFMERQQPSGSNHRAVNRGAVAAYDSLAPDQWSATYIL
jgi:hypothetical protein